MESVQNVQFYLRNPMNERDWTLCSKKGGNFRGSQESDKEKMKTWEVLTGLKDFPPFFKCPSDKC
jgi:hypothetical protein